MHRIDTPTAQEGKFGAGKNGFTAGDPTLGIPATQLDETFFDSVQEEICAVIEGAGIQLKKSDRAQLSAAINKMIQAKHELALLIKNNLSDVDDVEQARKNLGLGELALKDSLKASDVGAIPITGSTDITGPLRTTGEVQSSTPNGFRIAYGGYGAFWRNDSANLYLMLTDNGDPYGSYNGLRPFRVDLAKGNVSIGTPLYVASTIQADKGVQSGYVGSYAFSAQFATGAAFYETFNTTGVSEFHPLLKQKATITNKAAWSFSYGSLCDNGKLSWCLHMIDGSGHTYRHEWDTSGNYTCPGQLIPGNYANFDARYQAKNTANRASSGWYKDTSTGLIIQWGVAKRSADSTSIAYPIAFPNAALCTNLTVIWGGHFTDQNVFCQPVDRTRFNYIAGSGEVSSYFLAIGY
ncbi:gp53-like domain-containing protein [Cronobacter sakazakii]|uniref:phage tail fiber protein n=1 Tax=Cronobacter sakazakii TaxID=28141 RepID=UPI000A18A5A8|nr:phage tail protein [Cronobacter sakazakii]EGT5761023.1 phage tail protein [Cronobacter sakazakii]EIX1612525.1 phage tail protein [Cronobacter sakazakii]EIZ9495853.1 phage tail protein [Cronobacter sakazakii]EJG0758999.1 phage tail protein [Cronobacter sakazakii]EJJ0661061.1 phage tail protein [Cronobacter sakazakii]